MDFRHEKLVNLVVGRQNYTICRILSEIRFAFIKKTRFVPAENAFERRLKGANLDRCTKKQEILEKSIFITINGNKW